ncbi:MAG: hypothetical protein P8N94_03555 [Gammaproteobacteria bacterium]|nr:hypothetical protein [Gammaproteobacteria bacterium]
MSKFEAMRLVEIFSLHGRSKVTDCATLIFFSLSKNNEEKKPLVVRQAAQNPFPKMKRVSI